MPSAETVTVTLRIFGRVQGVGYRAWAAHTARRLQLSGWVRNLSDGSVEACASGSQDGVSAFIAACHAGPSPARVNEVRTTGATEPPGSSGFRQLPTAPAQD